MKQLNKKYYVAPSPANWAGRIDGEPLEYRRWHQQVRLLNLLDSDASTLKNSYAILGFQSDEGVRRNLGRPGAKEGPEALRRVLSNLPVHHTGDIYDLGDIVCENGRLEEAQEQLAMVVAWIRNNGAFPIVLGGGHEVTYGHFKGLSNVSKSIIGVINIDAHFDLRRPVKGISTSGTGFYQIANEFGCERFRYLALGIQKISNTKALFDCAEAFDVQYITRDDLPANDYLDAIDQVRGFAESVDELYLTIDLDAFAAPYAPGVSALSYQGIIPDAGFYNLLNYIYCQPKLISMDIAELNPLYDLDNRTARLAADLIFRKISI